MSIKKGDIVWLKSGGPKMTVKGITPEKICICIWFQHGEIQFFEFEDSTLSKSDPFESNASSETRKKHVYSKLFNFFSL